MKTGRLLEALINIAQTPKTDFALSMHMTPSGLSKILTGKRLPVQKEKRMFSQQAAAFLSETIYGRKCYMLFEKIFPVLYDFNSKHELELFLTHAIEYALDKDFAAENDDNESFDYPDRESSFLGSKTILNMLCILVSDYLMSGEDVPFEFYSTICIFSRQTKLYSDIFQRIKIIGFKERANLVFHHFFNMSEFESRYDTYHINVLSIISIMEQYASLHLWTTQERIEHYFLLLKGRFLMVFSILMDGTPLMTLVTHKSRLATFYNALMQKGARKISFSRREAIDALEADPGYVDRLVNTGIDAIYNFISIGHLVGKEELDKIDGNETAKAGMLKIFQSILTKGTLFYVTLDAMTGFFATGKAIVPLVEAVDFPLEERVPYLSRFNTYIDKDNPQNVIILNCKMPKVALLHSPGVSIIYLIDSEYRCEKIHLFKTDMLHNVLASEIADGRLNSLPFSFDLWDTYIKELSSRKGKPK